MKGAGSDVVRHEVQQERRWFYTQMLREAIKKEKTARAMFRHLTLTVGQ